MVIARWVWDTMELHFIMRDENLSLEWTERRFPLIDNFITRIENFITRS